MKTPLRFLATLSLAALATTSVTKGANLIENGGFHDTSAWTVQTDDPALFRISTSGDYPVSGLTNDPFGPDVPSSPNGSFGAIVESPDEAPSYLISNAFDMNNGGQYLLSLDLFASIVGLPRVSTLSVGLIPSGGTTTTQTIASYRTSGSETGFVTVSSGEFSNYRQFFDFTGPSGSYQLRFTWTVSVLPSQSDQGQDMVIDRVYFAAVPEPSIPLLVGTGGVMAVLRRRRSR